MSSAALPALNPVFTLSLSFYEFIKPNVRYATKTNHIQVEQTKTTIRIANTPLCELKFHPIQFHTEFLLWLVSPGPWNQRPRRPWLEDQRAVGLKKGCKGQNFPNFCGFCFLRSEDQRRTDFKEWAGNPLKIGYVLRQHRFSILFYSPPTLKSMWIWLKKFCTLPLI